MELVDISVAAQTKYTASGTFTVSAGNSLEVKGDEEQINSECPEGKVWTVSGDVIVVETDA